MATLVLTVVGTAVGGPIGGAIGALIGQQIDGALFGPKRRQGPRLGDLSVQTSSYGTPLPKLFGRMRVAGTIIWATDLQEHRATSGAGKGRAGSTSYNYSASFAVALSARPIASVGRIWADGNLLRGAAGDFKTETGFRLYLGGDDQDVDPLMGADEGIGSTPAYRGVAYVVFQDFQLADYGNRIPSLSFEIEADADPISVGDIGAELADGLITAGSTPSLVGYAASGDSMRGALETLAEAVPLSIIDNGDTLCLGASADPVLAIESEALGAHVKPGEGRTEWLRRAIGSVPDEVSIAYYDPARDWQTGVQRAATGAPHLNAEQIALPVALDASAAKAMAEAKLASLRAGRATAKLYLGWRFADIGPGSLVTIGGEAGLWKVQRWSLEQMVVTLELVRTAVGTAPTGDGASAGRAVQEPDREAGATILALMDLPLSIGAAVDRPQLLVAAAGMQAGWRRADLTTSFDAGASWTAPIRTALPAVMGTATSVLGTGGSALIDARNSAEVELANDGMWLQSCTDAALVGGANLALLGAELIQFGSVEPLGDRRFLLRRLTRGRRGTEWAAANHVVGEPFVLIEAEALATFDASISQLGGEAEVNARGIGDSPDGVVAIRLLTGEALRPPSPVHLQASQSSDDGIAISWVRRSRAGWSWLDGSDTPLAEEAEVYQLRLSTAISSRQLTLTQPGYLHSAVDQAGDGGGPLTIEVSQSGTFGSSRPATLTLERL